MSDFVKEKHDTLQYKSCFATCVQEKTFRLHSESKAVFLQAQELQRKSVLLNVNVCWFVSLQDFLRREREGAGKKGKFSSGPPKGNQTFAVSCHKIAI